MKQKDAVLIATGTAAGLYWLYCSRLPKLVFKYSTGIVAGIEYVFTAYGKQWRGTRPLAADGIESFPKGGYNLAIESDSDKIFFTLYDAAGKAIYLRVVKKYPNSVDVMI